MATSGSEQLRDTGALIARDGEPARRGARRRSTSGDTERLKRGEERVDQRLGAGEMWLLAVKEPPRLANFRADQEAGRYRPLRPREGAHERQGSRAKQEAEQSRLAFASRRRRPALNPERESLSRALRRRSLAKAPATVWSRSAAKAPRHECLERHDVFALRPAAFQCEPGSTTRTPGSAIPKISVSSPASHPADRLHRGRDRAGRRRGGHRPDLRQ